MHVPCQSALGAAAGFENEFGYKTGAERRLKPGAAGRRRPHNQFVYTPPPSCQTVQIVAGGQPAPSPHTVPSVRTLLNFKKLKLNFETIG